MNEPMIVAEISANHGGSLYDAQRLVEAAAQAGADAVKFQCWTEGTMALDDTRFQGGAWDGRLLRDIYREAFTPWHWFEALFDLARGMELVPFASVFDEGALQFLEDLGCPIYKIASFELTDKRLLQKVSQTGKPMILSTGMATYEEIRQAVHTIKAGRCAELTLLHCVSAYPAPPKEMNVATIGYLAREFRCRAGLSDHSRGFGVAALAAGLGAKVIEKHLCLPNTNTPDIHFSLNPREFHEMVVACRQAAEALGEPNVGPTKSQETMRGLRRGLYWAKDLPAGHTVKPEDIVTARPCLGMSALDYERPIDSVLAAPVARHDPVRAGQFASPARRGLISALPPAASRADR